MPILFMKWWPLRFIFIFEFIKSFMNILFVSTFFLSIYWWRKSHVLHIFCLDISFKTLFFLFYLLEMPLLIFQKFIEISGTFWCTFVNARLKSAVSQYPFLFLFPEMINFIIFICQNLFCFQSIVFFAIFSTSIDVLFFWCYKVLRIFYFLG